MKRIGFLSFALVATLTAGCSSDKGKDLGQATGSEPATVGASAAADIASQDAKDFIHHVAIVNMAEIDLGKLAADRGTADEVKKFAQMMIDDHTASGDKLKALASDLKIEAPAELDDKHRDAAGQSRQTAGGGLRSRVCERDGRWPQGPDRPARAADRQEDTRQWKAEMNGKTTVAGGTIPILPDPSDNPTTMRVNQFAADIYPTVHAHLEAAKALETSLKKRYARP